VSAAQSGRVTVIEVGPRDGLQNEPAILPTAVKARFVAMLADAGLPVVEVTSFVSPAAVPQLADADALLPLVERRPGVRYPVLVPNMRGLERARAAGADAIAVFAAASETFSQRNIGMSIDDSLHGYAAVAMAARSEGMWVRGYVSTAFGCPYEGDVPAESVERVAVALAETCDQVSIGDTIGVATPGQVADLVGRLISRLGADRLALHLHDTHGRAIENAAVGLRLGITCFDGSAGGLGGCPFAPGAPGNLATEALVAWLHSEGCETGVDERALAEAAAFIRAQLA
jgi:isopropylmalate/homocitrate/citramalate synthase